MDASGLTSTGKTTSLRLAASVWGQPNPAQPGSMLGSWNASPTYIERRAALFNGIPVILDDSKQARDPEFVARMIYDLASGQGKGRGTIGGLRRSDRWRTVVLTTGEQRLIDFTQDGGTRGRVITLWGPPFGARDTGNQVPRQSLPTALETDHGHAGPAFVAYLLQHREPVGVVADSVAGAKLTPTPRRLTATPSSAASGDSWQASSLPPSSPMMLG